jgi:hypothetical protein
MLMDELQTLSHEYLTQHGLAFEDNGDPNTFEWTAQDEMERKCKISFATERSHVLVQVEFEDEEEMYACHPESPLPS